MLVRHFIPILLLLAACEDAVTTGYTHLAAEEWQAAVDRFSEAIQADPDRIDAYIGRGMAWRRLDELDNAYADFNTALKRDPANATALQFRGEVRFYMGDTEGAVEDLEAASNHGAPAELLAEVIFARAHGRLVDGNLAGAAADFDRYASMVPEGPKRDEALLELRRLDTAAGGR